MSGLLNEYLKTLKGIEVEDLFDLMFYRPLGYVVVRLVAPTAITPNQITLLSVVFGVAGGFCYGLGTPGWISAGGVLCVLYNVLDCSDGQLARLKGTGTKLGRIIDGLGDYVVTTTIFVGIGIGLVRTGSDPFSAWMLVVGAGVSTAYLSMLVDLFRTRFQDMTHTRPAVLEHGFTEIETAHGEMKQSSRWTFERVVLSCYMIYSRVQRKFTAGNRYAQRPLAPDPRRFYCRNKLMIRLWTLIGPTMQLCFLIVCSFLDALEVYLWGTLTVANVLGLSFLFFQRRIDRQLRREAGP